MEYKTVYLSPEVLLFNKSCDTSGMPVKILVSFIFFFFFNLKSAGTKVLTNMQNTP